MTEDRGTTTDIDSENPELTNLSNFVEEHTSELGVTLAAVTNWRKRFDDFPEPVGTRHRPRKFVKSELIEWAIRHGKWTPRTPSSERGPVAVAHASLEANGVPDPDHTLALAVAAVELLDRSGDSRPPDHRDDEETSSPAAGRSVGTDEPALVVAAAHGRLDESARADVVAAIERHGSTPMALRLEFAELTGDKGYLDDPLTGTILVSAVRPGGTVHDPCCGSGLLLSLMARDGRNSTQRLSGREIDPALAAAARALLAADGIDATIMCGNSLAPSSDEDATATDRHQTVIADPPAEAPPVGEQDPDVLVKPAEWTGRWVTTVADLMSDDGSAGIVVPTRWLMAKGGHAQSTRRRLVDAGMLEAVVRVPTPTRNRRVSTTVVLVLDGRRSDRDGVLVVDVLSDRPPRGWDDAGSDYRDIVDLVGDLIGKWRRGLAPDVGTREVGTDSVVVDVVDRDNAREGYFFDLLARDHAAGVPEKGSGYPSTITPTRTLAELVPDRLVVVTGRNPELQLPAGTRQVVVLQTSGRSFGSVTVTTPEGIPRKSRGIAVFALSDVDDDEIPIEFLAAWLSSDEVQEHLTALGTGGAQRSRSVAHAEVLRLSGEFPSIDRRHRIARVWREIDEHEARLRDELADLERTRGDLLRTGRPRR